MTSSSWWLGATVYHVYVRSFRDSNGDGHGDLSGLIEKLDYLGQLGIDALWLSPTMPSPNYDWGYDVSDYRSVDPEFGTLNDLDALIADAKSRNIRVLLDLVPNHTSSEHPWFLAASSDRDSPYHDYYLWADAKPDGSLPNNWLDDTGEVAWEWNEATGQYYFHNFMPQQPELNWRNPAVHDEFDRIMDFWFDRGIAGFRIDVANGLYKDTEFRDNPTNEEILPGIDSVPGRHGLQNIYNYNQPEVHDVYRHWRARAESRADVPLLLGETWVHHVDDLAQYYGNNDELQLAFNFPFIFASFEAEVLADIVARSLEAFPAGSSPIWAGSNHDLPRLGTRWANGDQRRIRLAHVLLATLPGVYGLYYGDELGMPDSDIPGELHRDPLTAGGLNGQWPRDNARSPMRWDDSPLGGFTTNENPWLPFNEDLSLNVTTESGSKTSVLRLVQSLIKTRKAAFGQTVAPYEQISVGQDHWVYQTGDLRVHLNFSDVPNRVDIVGAPLLSSYDITADMRLAGPVELRPWEGVVTKI